MTSTKDHEIRIPKVSTIVKHLQQIDKALKDDPQEEPWTIVSLIHFPVHPEALNLVLDVSEMREQHNQIFTIREALWISRLYTLRQRMSLDRFLEIVNDAIVEEIRVLVDNAKHTVN